MHEDQALQLPELTDGDRRELEVRFQHHPPHGDQAERYWLIRDSARKFGEFLCRACPSCRETSVALTKLDEVVMFANAAIARREPHSDA